MAVQSIGYDQTFAVVCLAVTKGMEYFSEAQRLSPAQATLFAETLLDQYTHESLGDLSVFMRGAALGKYGEEDYKGEVVKRGQTYGQLTITRLMQWWKQYLGEKSDKLSEIRASESGAHKKALADALHPTLMTVVKEEAAKVSEKRSEDGMAARLERLRNGLPSMSDEALREAWPVYGSAGERALIHAEASRRGLLGNVVKEAQLEIDAKARANDSSGNPRPTGGIAADSMTAIPIAGAPKEQELNTKNTPAA